MPHNAEFLRCLVEIDVRGIRRLWHHVSPGLPQPANDADALLAIHLARIQLGEALPAKAMAYSKQWLAERETGRTAYAVGIAVGIHGPKEPRVADRLLNIRGEMEHAVTSAVQEGVDLAVEATEVKRRMMVAREKA